MREILLIGAIASAAFASLRDFGPRVDPAVGPTVDATVEPSLVVASFNIRYGAARERDERDLWANRRENVVATIRAWKPHVVGLQEALHMQVEFLRERFPEMGFVGQGRDGGEAGEYAGILFDRERLKLVDSGDFWLSETPDVVASVGWDAALTRMVTWAVFEDRAADGRRFKVWNTHFDHRGREARVESGKLLAKRVASSELPDVVLGDLNSTEDSRAVEALLGAGLVDTFRVVFPDIVDANTWSGWTGRAPGETRGPGRKIDYVLCDDGFVVEAARIDRRMFAGRAPSDHYPVTATLRFAPPDETTALDLRDRDEVDARRPLLIAHRGGVVGEGAPECSAEALLRAAADGYAMVELDVRRAVDGVPVVFHDASLAADCGVEGSVADLTADALAELPYRGSDQRVMTLDGALALCRRLGLGVMLDLKAGSDDEEFLQRIDRSIVAHGLEHGAVSFTATPRTREHLAHVMLTPTAAELDALRAGESVDLSGRFWFGLPAALTDDDVARLHGAGALVIPAVNTFRYPDDPDRARAAADIARLRAAGVDGFQIDSFYADLVRKD